MIPYGEILDVWLCPVCKEMMPARGEDAHCAGSLTEQTNHESVPMVHVFVKVLCRVEAA